jgi:hypothetical protein
MPTTATPDRRTSRWRRPHHLGHRRQDRLAGVGFGDQAMRQLGQVIAVGSRVAAQQREGIVHRHRPRAGRASLRTADLREGVDTATPTGRAIAAIMASLAELELELGRERRAASRESRRARHLPATKPPKLSPERQEQLRRLAVTGEPVHQLAEAFGIGRATAYRFLSSSPTCERPSARLMRSR